jgi:CheY-like chemotaxis protein
MWSVVPPVIGSVSEQGQTASFRRVLVVDDRSSFGLTLRRRLKELGLTSVGMAQTDALDLTASSWRGVDLVLLDALDIGLQQTDPTRSRLVCLDVLERIADAAAPTGRGPVIVLYSTAMARPEVNIPVRQAKGAAAFYNAFTLYDELASIVEGRFIAQVTPPSVADWAALDPRLPVGADVAGAHQMMRTHARSWEQIWRDGAPFDKAAQVWISRNVLPLLDSPGGGYALAVDVVRRISGLPFALV